MPGELEEHPANSNAGGQSVCFLKKLVYLERTE